MNVVLCDDDAVFMSELENKLSKYKCNIYKFKTAEGLFRSNTVFDIAFLDIELENNITGFQLVKILRERNKKCIIAFFTNHAQYAVKGYDYAAFRYILENEPNKLINRRIHDVFVEYYRRHKTFTGSYCGLSFKVELNDIFYISSKSHILTIHTSKGDFEIYKQLKELEQELAPFGFLRCHRKNMVNMRNISIMRSDYCFVLENSSRTEVPIGITYKDEAEKAYLSYVSEED